MVFAQTSQTRAGDWGEKTVRSRSEGREKWSRPFRRAPNCVVDGAEAFPKSATALGWSSFPLAAGTSFVEWSMRESWSPVFRCPHRGTESIITGLLPENVLEPVEPFFVLPEVRDPKQWWAGHIWADNAKRFVYAFVAYQTVSLWSNSNEYKPAEFRSFDDLLSPKLLSRIGISDPRTPGSGSSMWSYMNYIKGEEYLKRLVGQKLFVTRDLRLLAENLAKGKIAVTSGIGYSEFLPFIKANLPVTPLSVPKEGLYVSGGYGHVTILKNQPHPNATKVFVNWLLSRDGQEDFTRGMGVGTRRLDIDTKWLKEVRHHR